MSALAIATFIVLPVSTHAFSLDDAVMSYVNYLKARITALEAENEELQKNQCILGAMTKEVKTEVEGVKESYALVDFEPIKRDDKNYVKVKVHGVFTSAFLIVKNGNFDVATLSFEENQEFELGHLPEGVYTYSLKGTVNDDTTEIKGKFTI